MKNCTPCSKKVIGSFARRNIQSSAANYIPITYKATTECKLVIGHLRYYVGSAGPDIPSGGCTWSSQDETIFENFSITFVVIRRTAKKSSASRPIHFINELSYFHPLIISILSEILKKMKKITKNA